MDKIGIITFHAAHNYGSVLQAYATQKVIENLGYPNEIINYRLENQLQYYNHFYSTKFGMKKFIARSLSLPEHKKRSERREKFEEFINHDLKLSAKEYRHYEDLKNDDLPYNVLVSGSDQAWNIHCEAEFKTEPPESILGYYLAFGGPDAKRISFSTSTATMTKEELKKYQPYLKQFDYLSVREQNGADIVSELTGQEVINTLDPTLMLDEGQWEEITDTVKVPDKYIFLYTLTVQHHAVKFIEAVSRAAAKNDLKVICVAPFSSAKVPGVEYHPECGPKEFLYYIKHASLVITDSYHGTAFSINFKVPFYTVFLYQDDRKEQLLSKMALDSRKLYSLDEVSNIKQYNCDFSETKPLLQQEREKTLDFLSNALQDVCKKTQEGIAYKDSKENALPEFYMAIHKDPKVLKHSSSGGVFTALAQYTFSNNGVVCGAALNLNTRKVEHIIVDSEESLNLLRFSKYYQSEIGDIYLKVKGLIDQGVLVLFTGTACQIAALYKTCGRPDNLITADVLCHGVTSKYVVDSYINSQEKTFHKTLQSYSFRSKDKISGWNGETGMKLKFTDGSVYLTDKAADTFFDGYYNNLILRESCYNCKFCGLSRISDFTIGDFWGITSRRATDEEKQDGISLLLFNSEKGCALKDKLSNFLQMTPIDPNEAVPYNQALIAPDKRPDKRERIFSSLREGKDYNHLMKKIYATKYTKYYLRDFARKVLGKTRYKKTVATVRSIFSSK